MATLEQKVELINVLHGPIRSLSDLKGRMLSKAVATDDELHLHLTDRHYVRLYHEQDCCESVYIESIVGDLTDLVGSPILLAEEVTRQATPDEAPESGTWTFYKFATIKGYVDVRFLGTSNGYYSEAVYMTVVGGDNNK